jgi:ferredoxin
VTSARVTVDPDLCIGSAECVRILPSGFHIDEARGVSVAQPAARSADIELLAEVVRSCPTGAVRVVDAQGSPL